VAIAFIALQNLCLTTDQGAIQFPRAPQELGAPQELAAASPCFRPF